MFLITPQTISVLIFVNTMVTLPYRCSSLKGQFTTRTRHRETENNTLDDCLKIKCTPFLCPLFI